MISHYITNNNIYVIEITGNLKVMELDQFLDEFLTIPDLPEDILVLYDLRKGSIGFSVSELNSLYKVADRAKKHFRNIKTAMLVQGKIETAISMIIKRFSSDRNRKREVFNTWEAAINWLSTT